MWYFPTLTHTPHPTKSFVLRGRVWLGLLMDIPTTLAVSRKWGEGRIEAPSIEMPRGAYGSSGYF